MITISTTIEFNRLAWGGSPRPTLPSAKKLVKRKINPLGRWKKRLSGTDVAAIEAAVGECLEQNGYTLSLPEAERKPGKRDWARRAIYKNYLETKLWLKLNTLAGRLANLSVLQLQDAPAQDGLRTKDAGRVTETPKAEHHESDVSISR